MFNLLQEVETLLKANRYEIVSREIYDTVPNQGLLDIGHDVYVYVGRDYFQVCVLVDVIHDQRNLQILSNRQSLVWLIEDVDRAMKIQALK